MDKLNATLIDVGWGDSILLERIDDQGNSHFGLIDSNDEYDERVSYNFLHRHFEKRKIDWRKIKHLFDFVLLSHAHTDHGQGLQYLMQKFGTKQFWYPQSINWGSVTYLLRYAKRSSRVIHHQSLDNTKLLPAWGDVRMEVLWPEHHQLGKKDENNNSVVLALGLGNTSFVLTGDAEEEVWNTIADQIPDDTVFFKVPHHGSVNGTFGHGNSTPWFDTCPGTACLGISAHLKPHSHPHKKVVDLFDHNHREYFRTDHHYHITFATDGNNPQVQYSHV